VPRRAFESLALPASENGSGGGCSTYTCGLQVRPDDCARVAVPNHRLQLTGELVPEFRSGAELRWRSAERRIRNAGESPAAEA
jgi:hypothetical protein